MRRACLRLLAGCSLAVLSACGSDSTGAGDVLVVSQVDVQPPGAGLILGTTAQFTATPRTASGIVVPNRQVVWTSSSESIATVSATGLVTAVGLGESMISARVDGVVGSRPVNVSPKPVAQVLVRPPSANLFVGETLQLEVETRDGDGEPLTDRTIQYASDDPTVATVSVTGLVTAVTPGQTAIRAASEGKQAAASITVAARPAVRLGFVTQPANGTAGQALGTVRVAIQDETGATVTGSTAAVTVALGANPGSATLGGTLTVSAVAGIAAFTTLTLDKSATGYTLTAASGTLTGSTSTEFAIAAGSAAALAITTQPPGTVSGGAAFNPQPVVQVRDAHGNPVSQAGIAVTAALIGTGGTLGGTLSVTTNASGSAAFTNLSLTGQSGTYQLEFSSPGLTPATSTNIRIAAARLAMVTQPSASASSGTPLAQQPVVRLVDAGGAPVAQSGVVVTAAVSGGGVTVSGATATTNGSGVATFTTLTLTGKIGSYQLAFTSPGLTAVTSNPIALGPGPASRLALVTGPGASASSGVALSPQPTLQVQDDAGNPVAGAGRTVTAGFATTPGGSPSLSNATATTTDAGLAAFSGLAITGPLGPYTLRFSSTGLIEATSGTITVASGAAARIIIVTQPPNTVQNGQPWSATPVVRVEDADGNPVPGASVSVARNAGSTSGVLGGTLTRVTGSDGLASYADLTMTGPVGDYRIRWSTGSVNSANSREFTLTVGPAARLGIVTQPSGTVRNDQPFPTQPVVQVQDAGGNAVALGGAVVGAAIASGAGTLGSTGSTTATTNSNGRATFAGLKITGGVGIRTLQFSTGTLAPATSGSVNVIAGTATRIVLVTQPPSTVIAGQILVPNPVVDLEDVSGNDVDSSGVVITVSSDGGLQGTVNRSTGANGRATYSDLRLTSTGTRSLSFNRTGLQGVVSHSITVTPAPAQIVLTTAPSSSARSTIPLAQAPVIQVRDGNGGPVSGVQVNVALLGGGTLSGTTNGVSDGSGNVSFSGLTITGTVGSKTLRFTASGVPAIDASVTLAAGPATQLSMATQPGTSATSGVDLSPQPVVRLLDSQGNAVDSAGAGVTAELSQGEGTLNGTKTVLTNSSGQAAFSGLDITGTPGSFVIRFTASGLTPVQSSTITLNPPTGSMSVTQQPPASVASGASFGAAVVVLTPEQTPAAGVTVTVTLASGDGTLAGTTSTTTDANGQAAFANLVVHGTVGGGYTLRFTSGTLSRTSSAFSVTAGAPASIIILVQPSGNEEDEEPFGRQPVVEVRDSGGNLVAGVTVTAELVPTGTATGSLIGNTTAVTGSNGRATFSGLGINRTSLIADDYRIRFTAGSVSVLSNNIDVDFD